MLKEYNFPVIFQNIVGPIIPEHILNRLNHPDYELGRDPSEYQDNSKTSQTSEQNDNHIWVKSKKKKLQRRSQMFKTINFFTYRPKQHDQENVPPVDFPKFVHFLKKKQSNLSQSVQRSEFQSNFQNSSQVKTEMKEGEHQPSSGQRQIGKRNLYRVRTSIDRPNIHDLIIEENQNEAIQYVTSQSLSKITSFRSQNKSNISQSDLKRQAKVKSSKNTKKTIEKAREKSEFELGKSSRSHFRNQFQNRKKTVNFAVNPNQQSQQDKKFQLGRKAAQNRQKSHEKGNKSKLSQSSQNIEGESWENESKESIWAVKSAHSIKLEENGSLKSKKSIISNDEDSELHIKIKQKLRTKTATFLFNRRSPHINSYKEYNSENGVDPAAKEARSYQTNKIIISNQQRQTKKSRKQKNSILSKSRLGKKKKSTHPVSMLKKVQQPYLLTEAPPSKFKKQHQSPIHQNFHTKKKFSQNALKATFKVLPNCNNVYNQLNNFLKFVNDGDNIESERQIKRAFTKPMVIEDETNYKNTNDNRESFQHQNLCVDMGLRLIKKMNKLVQRKL